MNKGLFSLITYFIIFALVISICFEFNKQYLFIAFCLAWFSGLLNDIIDKISK